MLDTLSLRPSLHFTQLHFTPLHYTCRHFTSSHLNFTHIHFTSLSFGLTPRKFPTSPFHVASLHFTSPHFTSLHFWSLHCIKVILKCNWCPHNTFWRAGGWRPMPYVVSVCHTLFWKAYFGAWNEECRGIFRLWCRGWNRGWKQSPYVKATVCTYTLWSNSAVLCSGLNCVKSTLKLSLDHLCNLNQWFPKCAPHVPRSATSSQGIRGWISVMATLKLTYSFK
jgi:hypothetical protein